MKLKLFLLIEQLLKSLQSFFDSLWNLSSLNGGGGGGGEEKEEQEEDEEENRGATCYDREVS